MLVERGLLVERITWPELWNYPARYGAEEPSEDDLVEEFAEVVRHIDDLELLAAMVTTRLTAFKNRREDIEIRWSTRLLERSNELHAVAAA